MWTSIKSPNTNIKKEARELGHQISKQLTPPLIIFLENETYICHIIKAKRRGHDISISKDHKVGGTLQYNFHLQQLTLSRNVPVFEQVNSIVIIKLAVNNNNKWSNGKKFSSISECTELGEKE